MVCRLAFVSLPRAVQPLEIAAADAAEQQVTAVVAVQLGAAAAAVELPIAAGSASLRGSADVFVP